MDPLNERIATLEVDNSHMKQLIEILEQISIDLMPIVIKCKCVYNSVKIKTKINVLKHKYDILKQNIKNPNNKNLVKIVDKIKNCSKDIQKIIIKKSEEFDENDLFSYNTESTEEPIDRTTIRRGVRKTDSNYIKKRLKLENTKKKKRSSDQKQEIRNFNKQNGNPILRKYTKMCVNKEVSNRQIINKKRNEKNVLCNECGKQFRDNYELKFHEWRHSGQKLFACDWPGCNKQFSSRYLLKHQKTHSDPNRFICNFDDCDQTYESNEELNKHFKECHSGHKPFKCQFEDCKQEFASKTSVLQHNNWNHSSKQYVCEWPGCESSFKRKHLLRDHMNSKHMGDAKYLCEWPGCEFRSSHSKSFARHKLIHTGEKPFKCEFEGCVWRFRQSHQLKQHYLVHTGESPVCCQFDGCDQRFKTRRVMLSHFHKSHTLQHSNQVIS